MDTGRPPTDKALNDQLLKVIQDRMRTSESFFAGYEKLRDEIRNLLQAERVTIYKRGRSGDIHARMLEGNEIRLVISPTSIAGFVAMSHRPLLIQDVYDEEELKAIDERLRFAFSFDRQTGFRTRSMMVLPILRHQVLVGVLQVINHVSGGAFGDEEWEYAQQIADLLAEKFSLELQGTKHPFEQLLLSNKISPDALEKAKQDAAREGVFLTQVLKRDTTLNARDIGTSLERYYQVPFVEFDRDQTLPPLLMEGINEKYLRQQLFIPIGGDEEEAVVLVDNPADPQKQMDISRMVRARSFTLRVGLPEEILFYIENADRMTGTAAVSFEAFKQEMPALGEGGEIPSAPTTDLDEGLSFTPSTTPRFRSSEREKKGEAVEVESEAVRKVDEIIRCAYETGASDIHIAPGRTKEGQPARIRIRVDGVCRDVGKIPADKVRQIVARIKIISNLDIAEQRKPQDGKCFVDIKGRKVELRTAIVPTVNGEGVVLRVLASSKPLSMDELNLSKHNLSWVKRLVTQPNGLFLVVGPTGSGKTTTLHSILHHINTPEHIIWTAEDPVEITQAGLNQVQVNPKINLTFASALRSFLRADPDVIMIGEMRDKETAEVAVESSLTGHLVISTLHTNSAPETVTRLLDLGLDPMNFSDALLGVLSQRLIRTLCKACKKASPATPEELDLLSDFYGTDIYATFGLDREKVKLYRAGGCQKCADSGYKGRTGLHELLINTQAIKEMIPTRPKIPDLRAVAIGQGMRTLMQDGVLKVLQGQTDLVQLRKIVREH